MPRRLHISLAAAVGLSLAACGGQVEATPRAGRGEPTPVLGTLASSGPGTAELRAGDLPAARAAFESALGADPDRVAPLNDLAVSYYLDGRFEAARRLLDEVVARGGAREQQAALVNLGELYALEGYVSAAHAHLESARGIDASRAEPLYALAMLADARGERAQAAATLREALRLDESGAARAALTFVHPEERLHLEALVAEVQGDRELAAARWRELRAGRFAALATAAARHLEEP
ncbi:MAG TPA: tetratricopeptide repeat protein [Anaeromyxobacteraceae bacterium]|nr:tetratricopeptide repeat protein [Anaeromyxobacteraceae bacterium]